MATLYTNSSHKRINSAKRIKVPLLITWISAQSKRKKKCIKFFYYLEKFRQKRFSRQANQKKTTLNKISKVFRAREVLITKSKKKRKRRYYWFFKKKKYAYNSYTVLKNYCMSNFKKHYTKSFICRKRKKRKRYVKHIKRWARNKRSKVIRVLLSWRRKKHLLRKRTKRQLVRSRFRRWKKKLTSKMYKRKASVLLFQGFKRKGKLCQTFFVNKRDKIAWKQRTKVFNRFRFKAVKKNSLRQKRPMSLLKANMSTMHSDFLLGFKRFKEFYNFEYLLCRRLREINLEELYLSGYIKEYNQTGFGWRFNEPSYQKSCLPWLQILITNRKLYQFQNYNMLRRERPMHITKKNKIYKKFLMATHHPFQKIKLKPRKRGGNRYIGLKNNLLKSILPHFNRLHKSGFKSIWKKYIRIKSRYLTRDMKFWNQLNLNFYSASQLMNWAPTTLLSNFSVKKGWMCLATNPGTQPQWINKCNFPFLMDLHTQWSTKSVRTNKISTQNSKKVLHQNDIVQINPYTKKYLLSFFNRKNKWHKKPVLSSAFDRNSTYNAAIVNGFTRNFPLQFKNRITKANMKYLKPV